MGDTAARVSAGAVPNVTPERIAAVVLFADPGRCPAVGGAGPVSDSRFGTNGELIIGGGTGVLDGREGMTGSRTGRFTGMEGRVYSLCNSRDMACSSIPGSLIRDVADYGNRVETQGVADAHTAASIRSFVEATGQGVPPVEAAVQSGLGLAQLWSAVGSGIEVAQLLKILHSHTHEGLSDAELIGLCLVAALPNLIKTGVRTDYLMKAVAALSGPVSEMDGDAGAILGSALDLFTNYAELESLYMQLGHANLLPEALSGGSETSAVQRTPSAARQHAAQVVSQRALDYLAKKVGLGPALADPRNAPLLKAWRSPAISGTPTRPTSTSLTATTPSTARPVTNGLSTNLNASPAR